VTEALPTARSTQAMPRPTPRAVARRAPGWHPGGRLSLLVLAGCALAALAYLTLATLVAADDPDSADVAVSTTLNGWSTPWLDRTMLWVTHLGDSVTVTAVAGVSALWAALRGRAWVALPLLAATPAGQLLVDLLKGVSARQRPDLFTPLDPVTGYSFPSGHTFSATLAWGLVAALAASRLSGRARLLPWLAWAVVVLGVGTSRVYLGAHYLTDVVAAVLVGTIWVVGWVAVIDRFDAAHRARRRGRLASR
jgi:membrane-associated phospholipid phosphatase